MKARIGDLIVLTNLDPCRRDIKYGEIHKVDRFYYETNRVWLVDSGHILNNEEYELKEIFDSPLYKALKEE